MAEYLIGVSALGLGSLLQACLEHLQGVAGGRGGSGSRQK